MRARIRNHPMKYVLAGILLIIAIPIVLGLINMVIGTAFAILKLVVVLAVIVFLAALVMRLLNATPR